jgi:circadian clock protein KaiC
MQDLKASGVAGLDVLLGGGLPAGSVAVLSGASGTGKTMLALEFAIRGSADGEACVFVLSDEKPRHLLEKAAFLRGGLDAGLVHVLDASPYLTAARSGKVHDPRMLVADIAQQVRATRATRLVLDSLGTLVPDDLAARPFVRSLFLSLEDNLGCTVVATCNPDATPALAGAHAESLASTVIGLLHGTGSGRSLSVRKARHADVDPRPVPFRLEAGRGLVVEAGTSPKRPGLSAPAPAAS